MLISGRGAEPRARGAAAWSGEGVTRGQSSDSPQGPDQEPHHPHAGPMRCCSGIQHGTRTLTLGAQPTRRGEDTQPALLAGRCGQVCSEEGDVRHQAEAPRPSPESVPSGTRGTASLTYQDCGQRFCYGRSPPGTRRKTGGSSREEPGVAELSAPQTVRVLRVCTEPMSGQWAREGQCGTCCCHSVFFLAVLGLRCFVRAFSCGGEQGLLLTAVCRLLIAEHRL